MNQWPVYNDSVCTIQDTTVQEGIVPSVGMKGTPIPYKLYSDGNILLALAICLFLIVEFIRNNNKSLWKLFKSCLVTPGRSSLFDSGNNQIYIYRTLFLCPTTTIMCGLLIYIYHSYSSPEFFTSVNHTAMLLLYVSLFFVFLVGKWILYTVVDWIFFDKESRKLWHQSFFNIISSMGPVLYVASIFMIFLNLDTHISFIITLIIIVLSKLLLFYNCVKYFFCGFYGSLHLILYFCTLEIIPDLVLWKSIGLVNSILI